MRSIAVVDSSGKYYAPTYPRRARGLIKAGRARWSDNRKKKICLTVDPAQYEEVHTMNENDKYNQYDNDGNLIAAAPFTEEANGAMPEQGELSIRYILEQMEKIRTDNTHLHKALEEVIRIHPHPPSVSGGQDLASKAMAEAIQNIVTSRETTNQKLLAMYEVMYDDIKPPQSKAKSHDFDKMMAYADKFIVSDETGNFGNAFGRLFGEAFKGMFE